MTTVYHDDASVSRASISGARSDDRGFTLIELLVVLALLAFLPALIPAIQKARESVAHAQASASLNQLVTAARDYRARRGSFPRGLDELVGWSFTPLDPEVAQGNKNGYLYEIVESDQNHCRIETKPEYPGITGSLCFGAVIEGSVMRSYQIISAGADRERERVFEGIRAKAAETVANLLRLEPSATREAREYVESHGALNDAFNALDRDDDGTVSVEELMISHSGMLDDQLSGPLDRFLAHVARELKFDRLSEDQKRAIAVGVADFHSNPRQWLFSYDQLSHLTEASINQSEVRNSLSAILEAAATAEASGNLQARNKAIRKYQNQLRSQVGQAISGGDAQRLIALAEAIISAY
jgi:prepilin-type N-terminal cleavage/methylation domain-containing protein